MIGKTLASSIGALVMAGLLSAGSANAAGGSWDSLVGGLPAGTTEATGSKWITGAASGSSYAEWNLFDLYPTDNTPDVAGAGSITETSGLGFICCGGNVYSPTAATAFTATLAGSGSGLADVWLRISTNGNTASDGATLNGISATHQETFSAALGGFGGFEKEWYWHWTGIAAAPSYEFKFTAADASVSLDQVALYATVAAVPEPQTYALLLAGLVMVGAIARRRLSA